MHKSTGTLLLEIRGGGTADVEGAFQVDSDDRVEILFFHLVKQDIAQIASIVDDSVDPAECVDRRSNHFDGALVTCNAAAIGNRASARFDDFINHLLSWRNIRFAIAFQRAAQIVDHHCGPRGRHFEGYATADAAAGACNKGNFAFHRCDSCSHAKKPAFNRIWEDQAL